MALEDLRKKVLYQNSVDVWIEICKEKNIPWMEIPSYKKFIGYLQDQKLSMKPYPLCVSDAESSIEIDKKKASFAESLAETKDPHCATFSLKLNDSTLDVLRKFSLVN